MPIPVSHEAGSGVRDRPMGGLSGMNGMRREREQASNFNTALYEHTQYLRRKKEAQEMRQAYESAASGDAEDAAAGSTAPQQDLSLKPGQTLKLKLSTVGSCHIQLPHGVWSMPALGIGGQLDIMNSHVAQVLHACWLYGSLCAAGTRRWKTMLEV